METPQNIIARLLRLGFSQKEIASHVGVPESTISRIYNGKQNPRWQVVDALRAMLDTFNTLSEEIL